MPTIVLDPGHNSYGQDTGAEGNGLKEQDITLDICKKLKPLLEYNGFNVIVTRTGDLVTGLSTGYTLNQSLQYRVNIANNAKADLFVSVHVNAGGGTGSEVYALSAGSNAEKCAKAVAPYLAVAGSWNNRGVKFNNYYVLKYTDMPAILTESGFIDTAADANKLAQDSYRQKIAVAHAKGICEYFGIQYKEESVSVEEANKMQGTAIVIYSWRDIEAGGLVQETLANYGEKSAGIFNREAKPEFPIDAINAKQVIIVGGPDTLDQTQGHSNKVILSGDHARDTLGNVVEWTKKFY